jgi:hypothetical protein
VLCGRAESEARTRDKKTIVQEILLGFMLVAICVLIHATSIVFIGEWLAKRRQKLAGHLSVRIYSILLSSVFGIIILLHFVEITIWAITYYCLSLFNDFRTSLDFSLGSYTCNSAPGLQLPGGWKLLGQLESIVGPLLIGLSTAFLFLAMRKMFEFRWLGQGNDKL